MVFNEVYIVSHARTPIGSFRGKLSPLSAVDLGKAAIEGAVERASIDKDQIQEVFMGCVLQAGLGQSPARQASLKAGLSVSTPCTNVNKVCASGMKAIMLGAQSLMLGHQEVVVAGGMESMSNVPYFMKRGDTPYGGIELKDGLLSDGLTDSFGNEHMGECAEGIVAKFAFSRKDQDDYAIKSYERTLEAAKTNFLQNEIVPVTINGKNGKPDIMIDTDEEYSKVNFGKIPLLKPVFMKHGTITPANASSLSDGAAACVMATKTAVENLYLKPVARILSFADAAVDPYEFPIAPAYAVPKVLQMANIKKEDVDLWEINEAFSVASLANMKILNLDIDKINIHGGAVSLGHPLGMSGARIVFRLIQSLSNKQKGIAAICNGGGGASAILLEKL